MPDSPKHLCFSCQASPVSLSENENIRQLLNHTYGKCGGVELHSAAVDESR